MNSLKKRFPIYSSLLRLYPAPFRHRYEEEQLQSTADMLDAAPDGLARFSIWIKLCLEVPLSLISEHLAFAVGPMSKDTPRYVKLASVTSSLFLLPFFVLVAVNVADKVMFNQTLENSWFWRLPQLTMWGLELPLAALVIAGVSCATYVFSGQGQGRTSWWQRAIDIRCMWPVLVPVLASCGILFLSFFHD